MHMCVLACVRVLRDDHSAGRQGTALGHARGKAQQVLFAEAAPALGRRRVQGTFVPRTAVALAGGGQAERTAC